MQKEVIIIILAIVFLTFSVIIPMIRHVSKFGLEEQFMNMEANLLSNSETAKLILQYNMRCLGGVMVLFLIYLVGGIGFAMLR